MVKLKFLYPLLILIILILGFAFFSSPADTEFNEDYINSNILALEDECVEKILMSKGVNNSLLTLCATDDNELMLLLLDSEYDLLFRLSFDPQKLAENPNEIYKEKIPMSNKTLYYNIFLNPTQETVTINNHTLDVNALKHNFGDSEYQIGFWCYAE